MNLSIWKSIFSPKLKLKKTALPTTVNCSGVVASAALQGSPSAKGMEGWGYVRTMRSYTSPRTEATRARTALKLRLKQ